MNSSGAAPVPPSLPSTTMKSGWMPVSSIALQIARNSHSWPTQSLKPAGLPPDSRRISPMNCIISIGGREGGMARRRNAVLAGRHAAGQRDLDADLGRRQHAAMAGLGALAHLELDHLDLLVRRRLGELLGEKVPSGLRQPK
jgi:hypothetical protein